MMKKSVEIVYRNGLVFKIMMREVDVPELIERIVHSATPESLHDISDLMSGGGEKDKFFIRPGEIVHMVVNDVSNIAVPGKKIISGPDQIPFSRKG